MTVQGRPRSRAELLAQLAADVDELTAPYSHSVRVERWNSSRNRVREKRTVEHRSLLDQVHALVMNPPRNSDDSGTHSVPGSRPPGGFSPLDVLLRIEAGSALWLNLQMGIPLRETVQENLRGLVGGAQTLPDEALWVPIRAGAGQQKGLIQDVRSWRTWCRVTCGWMTAPRNVRGVSCPSCGRLSVLRAVVREHETLAGQYETEAFCTACGEAWDDETIGLLQAHLMRERRADDSGDEGAA